MFGFFKHKLEARNKEKTTQGDQQLFTSNQKISCHSIWISTKLRSSKNKILSELLKSIIINCKPLFYLISNTSPVLGYITLNIQRCFGDGVVSVTRGLGNMPLFFRNRYMNRILLLKTTSFQTAGSISVATVGFVVEHSILTILVYLPNPMRMKDPTTMINVCKVSV